MSAEAADHIVRAVDDGRLGPAADIDGSLAWIGRNTTPEQLRTEIRRREQAATADAMLRDEQRQHAARRLSITDRPDGMVAVNGQLSTQAGDRLRTLIHSLDRPDSPHVPDQQRRTHTQRCADALDVAVTQLLARGRGLRSSGGRVPQVTITVEATTALADLTDPDSPDADAHAADVDATTGDGTLHGTTERPVPPDHPIWASLPGGRLAWGGTISPQAVRAALCDPATSTLWVDHNTLPLALGRATRKWSVGQRRAIEARDQHCKGPRCDRPVGWTQIHHLRWWRNGGPTDVTNGLLLCHRCHHLIHDHGWDVRLDHTGDATWTSPEGAVTVARRPT